jgi:hypothetical protein
MAVPPMQGVFHWGACKTGLLLKFEGVTPGLAGSFPSQTLSTQLVLRVPRGGGTFFWVL